MEQIVVNKATLYDLKAVQFIARETFSETFAEANSEDDMKKYLDKNFSDDKIRTELSNPDSMFFVAWKEQSPIGYLKVNSGKAQTELQDEQSLEIERIYVKSTYHGQKIGQLLYDKALEVAHLQQKSFIWLGVWEENPKAIRFYEKNGFVAFNKHIFKVGEDEQIDVMMKKVIA